MLLQYVFLNEIFFIYLFEIIPFILAPILQIFFYYNMKKNESEKRRNGSLMIMWGIYIVICIISLLLGVHPLVLPDKYFWIIFGVFTALLYPIYALFWGFMVFATPLMLIIYIHEWWDTKPKKFTLYTFNFLMPFVIGLYLIIRINSITPVSLHYKMHLLSAVFILFGIVPFACVNLIYQCKKKKYSKVISTFLITEVLRFTIQHTSKL